MALHDRQCIIFVGFFGHSSYKKCIGFLSDTISCGGGLDFVYYTVVQITPSSWLLNKVMHLKYSFRAVFFCFVLTTIAANHDFFLPTRLALLDQTNVQVLSFAVDTVNRIVLYTLFACDKLISLLCHQINNTKLKNMHL
jgi:hypothetical protein